MQTFTTEAQKLLLSAFRPAKYRPMGQFAEEEITIPSGEYEGFRFSLDRQPYARHWFEAVDSGHYSEMVLTGPSQSGKSLNGFVIPILYTLFELNETCIAAVPDDDLVREKWERDLLPVIERTRYRDLLPIKGPGSRGGRSGTTQLGNGARLIWMTAGGGDKSRASVTARVICMTETDGFDVRTSTSDEADKIEQIEARTYSYDIAHQRIFKECTLTTEYGHTWQRYEAGTASRLMLPCPHCKAFVQLERSNFNGWQEAENEVQAMENSAFFCSECGEQWTEKQRIAANSASKLVHRGQEIDNSGVIHGKPPQTRCLGFRWSAVNNCLVPSANVARQEYKARDAEDDDNAERKMCQFVWATPYKPANDTSIRLKAEQVCEKQATTGRGHVPDDTKWLGVGVDVNQPVLHWTAIGWSETDGLIHDYDTTGVPHKEMPIGAALEVAFRHLAETLGTGWHAPKWQEGRNDKPKWWDCVAVDARWEPDAVIGAIRALDLHKRGWMPFMGFGLGQYSQKNYAAPKRVGQNRVVWIGERCHVDFSPKYKMRVLNADSNHWKTWMHRRIALDNSDGLLRLYAAPSAKTHFNFARHITAEVEEMKFEPGKGHVRVWNAIRSQNHFGDSTYISCVLGHYLGFGKKKKPTAPISNQTRPQPVDTRRQFNQSRFRVRR